MRISLSRRHRLVLLLCLCVTVSVVRFQGRVEPRQISVVPHTHWDREWYRPFESYRYRLIQTVDSVLGSELPYFLLDGQTIILEDYLALRPDQRSLVQSRIRAQRLGIGPWYVLADEFLVSGESLVRNLLEGRRTMEEFGAAPAVGYLPDMFGHIAQMPQILRGFGLDQAVVWRGAHPRETRFMWRSPDGSEVATSWLPQGYYQTMLLEPLSLRQRLASLDAYVSEYGESEPVLLLSGADHMAPRLDVEVQLAEVEQARPGWTARVVPLQEALKYPPPAEVIEGELRDNSETYILPGVLSARTYLKQANFEAQCLLERYVEPLTTLAWWSGREYPAAYVRYVWKTLLRNHPHDSICGCSIDQVHREMIPRFAAVHQVGGELIATAVGAQRRPRNPPALYAFNPTGYPQTTWVEAELHWPLASAPESIRLIGAADQEVPVIVRAVDDTRIFRAEIDFNPDWFPVRRFRIAAKVSLPGLGSQMLTAVPGVPTAVATDIATAGTTIENALVRLSYQEGRLDLVDKVAGITYRDCHYFLDEGDAGDSYNFSPLVGDVPRRARVIAARIVEQNAHDATLEVLSQLVAPTGLNVSRLGRSDNMDVIQVRSHLTVSSGSRLITVETTLDNTIKDHRLRVITPLGRGRRPTVWADSAYGVFKREAARASVLPVAKGKEARVSEFPQGLFTALERPDRALIVANRGLSEAAVIETPSGWALATTLLRAVGWLSRDDLRTRGGGAGPSLETPEAQCQGRQTFHYALMPYRGRWSDQLAELQGYKSPLRAWEGEGLRFGQGIDFGHPHLVLSALKRSDDGTRVVVRAFNPTPVSVSGLLSIPLPHQRVWESTLAEVPTRETTNDPGYTLKPYEIRTWLIEPLQH